ncbi:hypothetical protein [Streptomyces lavendofoliae]|uniref:hypothetical protein n=1 Tax=Streptomyces lavendofoliae TaxID=67314 RepID=UPI00300F1654
MGPEPGGGAGAGYAGAVDGAGPDRHADRRADGAGAGPGRVPGCGSSDDEGGLAPAVPPRPCSPGELLAALHVARAAPGAWGPDETAPQPRPDRGPPPLVAPSPLDLSILRV